MYGFVVVKGVARTDELIRPADVMDKLSLARRSDESCDVRVYGLCYVSVRQVRKERECGSYTR